MVKQVIVMRKYFIDENGKKFQIRRGKQIAQACHASMKIFFDRMEKTEVYCNNKDEKGYYFVADDNMIEWIDGIFTKICVSVDSEEELLDINKKAEEANLPVALIQDVGKTEFNGVPTYTCLAIGPAKAEDIDEITGGLKLL